MRGFKRLLLVFVVAAAALVVGPVVAQVPVTRLDVVEAVDGACRYRYVLEAHETRLIYCDLSGSELGNFAVAVESGSYDVPGWVSDVFTAPAGAVVVLRNDSDFRRRGTAWARTLARP